MAKLTQGGGITYRCKACGVHFAIPREETAACCPVCRMNRMTQIS